MNDQIRIKIIECPGYRIVYNDEDLSAIYIPDKAGECNKNDAVPLVANLSSAFYGCLKSAETENIDKGNTTKLRKVSLIVSTQCNMACRYCYADGGKYKTAGLLMKDNTALAAINYVRRVFGGFEHLNFFGGEPTIHAGLIDMVCRYIHYLHDRGVLPVMPRFGITTNGYEMMDELLDIIIQNRFSVCVSLDGPAEIHDRLRIARNGGSTYRFVSNTIKRLIDSGIAPEFECTYTAEHRRLGITIKDLMDFFAAEFGCRTLHCPIVMASPDSSLYLDAEKALPVYVSAIQYSINNLATGIPRSLSIATRLLMSLTEKRPQYSYCPAGRSALTINVDGNLYPCFMLMDSQDYCIGHIDDTDQNTVANAGNVLKLISNSDKWRHRDCQTCWIQSICFGCIGEDQYHHSFRSSETGQSPWCDFRRTLRETFLSEIGKLLHQEAINTGAIHQTEQKNAF